MPRQVQIGVLAVAALAALAVAGIRIAHATHGTRERTFHIPVMGSTPAAEAAVLKALRVPAGFRPYQPCNESACYVESRSLPLDTTTARDLTGAFGVKVASSFVKGSPVECGVIGDRACQVEGIVKGEYVTVWVTRPAVRNPKPRTRRNRRTYGRFVTIPGTEVEVSVIGHCLHPKECAEMAHQEATEARSEATAKR